MGLWDTRVEIVQPETQNRKPSLVTRVVLPLVLALSVAAPASQAGEPRPGALLTNAQQVFNLGVEGARRESHPVRLTLVVTYPVLRRDWFYAQDRTGGILVVYTNTYAQPSAGQLIQLEGVAIPGLS